MHDLHPMFHRGSHCYDPNRIGAVSMAKVMAALVAAGKMVLIPTVSVERYDLVIDDGGQFFRVQCKTGRLLRGAVYFRVHSLRAERCGTGWMRRIIEYKGAVDFFGVYCPEMDEVYLVPMADVSQRYCGLRVEPAKNNQSKRIRWAKDYRVVPLPIAPGSIEDIGELN